MNEPLQVKNDLAWLMISLLLGGLLAGECYRSAAKDKQIKALKQEIEQVKEDQVKP
jgi:hypothetical protein